MKKSTILSVLIYLLVAVKTASAQTGLFVPGLAGFDTAVFKLLNNWGLPGGQLAITYHGRLVYNRGFGYADTAAHAPVEANSIFRVASCSKPITSIAIMHLYQQGRIQLTDTVFGPRGILNDTMYQNPLDPRVFDITIYDLLTHSGGWNSAISGDPMFNAYYIATVMGVQPPADSISVIRYTLRYKNLDFTPGTQYQYSNFGFCILGRVIEKLTGQSYTTFVEDSILFPLGLTDMTQGKNLLPQQALNEVHYYDFPGDPLAYSVYDNVTRVPWPYAGFNIQAMDSHGAWVTSASDYCKIICSVDGFNTTPQILSPSTITTMVTPSPTNANYALGWGVSGGTWWHDGSLPGTQTDIVRTSEQVNWALFTNMRTSNYDSLQIALDAVVWNVLPTITSWPNFNLFNPTTAPVAKFGAMVMSQCSGAYQFTDSSINAYTWLWNFGDGTTSYEQNPFHTYGTNGAYSVSLTVANDSGSNTKTISNYITISKPAGPVASSVSSCTPASFSLSVTNSNPVFWYDSASDVVSITNTFTTPMLTATTTYWVEDWNEDSTNYIGPASLAIGGGYYYYFGGTDNYFQLKFKVSKPVILQSVLIYSVTAGNQTVLYTDSGGTIITSRTVYIPVGTSRITLNINLMPGGPYYLGFPNDSFIEYTQTGAAYPYSDPENAVTITGNNFEDEFGSGYTGWYPYFYDWIIAEHYCISERTPVTAEVVHPDTTWLSATICMGNNYNFNGTNLTTSGVYSKNLTASTSCDSTIILTLIVNPSTVGGNASVLISNLCSGSSTSVNLTGYRGTIQWQSSPDNITFTNITGATSSTYTTPALTSTTYYRAAITSGVCASANSTTAIVTINPVSVGGTASAIDNPICSGGSTTINLTGYTGSIQWQSSTDDITFTNITGATSSSYTTPALTSTTYYRAVVTSGVCASTNSTTTTVTINPISVGGTGTATNGTICSGSSTSVNVTGNTGSIQWQSSTDDITFTNITGATSSNYTTPALTLITYYRAEVTNGVCAAINSTTATVTINPVSVGGTATAINGTICTGSSTSINLTGNTGSIQWQTSPDNITFTNIGGATSSSYTTPNLTSITYYRAVVTSGVCDYANSTTATVTINSVSVGGVATATNGTICSGSSTSINLTGDTGNIQWQSSPDNITFTNISGATSSSYTTPSLTSTTYYRAVVTSGVCASANSTTATITVNPASLGGTATATASTLCTGSSTSINLSGNTGSIQWQSSPDNNTFTTIGGAISSSYTTPSLTSTTYYRAVATSGVCASANSTTATVTVDPVSVGGTATATNGTICSGSSTSINLSGNTGSIQWQSSPDNNTFTSIGGATSSSYTTPSLTSTTYYRAVVTSGVCASANSTTATVTVNPVSVGGTATATNGTICSGSSTSINLTGNTGSIQWQSSTNNVTFNNINGAISTTYNTPSLSATTYYRALIISSACATANSTTAVVNINTLSAGGNASAVAVTVCMGSPATVNLTGNSGSIQWQSSADNITFNNINGASSSSYTAPSLAVTTWYRAVVTSGVCVSANSTTATVSVSPLSIAGSANATTPEICSGSSATLSLTGNSGNIQWQSSTDNITFNNITGATAPGYNISVLTSTAYYRAMVTSGVCAATVTDTVVITVDNASAGGTVNAAQDTLCPGNATVLALSGNVGLIQWQSSADNLVYNNIPGATSGTYTTPVLVSTTYYRVASTNDVCPSAYSASNALMVLPATVIQAGPISQVACQGSQVVFNVSASGANLVYQWYKKGNNITGSTAPSYAIDSVSAVDSAVYYVSVAGTCGTAISDTVSLALTGTLQISQQPVSQSLCLGNQVVFSVTVNGVNVHYQWMQNNDTIVNALSSTYSVPAINVSDSGTYVCRISSTCGDISSNLAALSILQPSFNSYNQNWCSGTPYVFNGRNLTTSGTYSDTLQAANSCDSIVTITLTLIPVRHDSVYQTICSGQSYSFNGNHLTTSGSYNDTLPGANGCDSIVTLILTALRVYNTTVSQTICFGQSFVFNQHGCQATGTYPDTLISINNCDSIVTLYLTVLPFSGSTISDTVCADRVYNFNGRFILTAGMYYDTLPNANGCDSLVTLNLVVLPTVVTSLQRTVCAGNTYNFNGQLLATGGVYSDTLQAVNGCDSIVNLTLGILPTSSVTLNVNVCQGSACFFNGHYISTAGTYRDTLPGANGCDSITILNLATPSVIFTTLSDTICSGNNYLFNGTVLTGGGTYTDTLMALGGCDSIVILTLGLRQTSVVALADTICAGSSYSFNGRLLSVGGVYSDTLTNINGCDSFVTLNLIVLPVDTSVLTEGICFGGGYMFNGHLLSTAGTYYDTITGGLYGCDSIVVLHLTVEPVITDSVSGFICHGGNYPFNGRLLTTAGIYADTLHIAAGCDSVVVLILIERPASVTALTDSICMGSSYNFNGRVLSLPGSYNDTIPAGNTCDSVISLNLIVKSMNDSATVSGPICIALENGAIYQWMDCNTNNHITGATSQTYTALRNGNYKCVITIGNCSDTSNCVNVTTIAIKAITDYSFNLYPNPNSGIFTIEHNYKGNLKVQIVSIIGDEVKTFSLVRPIEQFDINELAAGVYEVFISDDKQLLKVLKIVKQ